MGYGVGDTPQTVMTTRAPAVLKIYYFFAFPACPALREVIQKEIWTFFLTFAIHVPPPPLLIALFPSFFHPFFS